MLRKHWETANNWRKPATCHEAIPNLSPGRYHHGIASIDYTLVVCGGRLSKCTFLLSEVNCFTKSNKKIIDPSLKEHLAKVNYFNETRQENVLQKFPFNLLTN